jgi:probable HAF family extracellular repeat protein
MHDLGTLGGPLARALDVNNLGQVVGISNTASDSRTRAFLFSDGKMIDLNSVPVVKKTGWFLDNAFAINNSGQIAGSGTIRGVTHAFLLTPVTAVLSCAEGIHEHSRDRDHVRTHDCNPRNFPFAYLRDK